MTHVGDLLARDRDELNLSERQRVDAHLGTCGACRALQADLTRTDQLLRGKEPQMPLPRFDRLPRAPERATPFVLATVGALAVLAVLVLAPILGTLNERAAQSTSTPLTSATPMPTPSASPSASPLPSATYENAILGYRISLPEGYRRSRAELIPGNEETLGLDVYVRRSEIEERELCLREQGGGLPSPERESDIRIVVHRDVVGLSALEWANSPTQRIALTSVQPVTIDGREAAKVVHQSSGDSALYVIRANDRIYEITPELMAQPSMQPKGWLDQIAASFRAIAPQPFPTVTAPASPTPRCGN